MSMKPSQALNRRKAQERTLRIVNQGYGDVGGSTTKRALKGFDALSGSAQRDIDDNNYTIRQRARMLYMGAPIATSAIRTNRTNVIGTGLIPKSAIDADYLGMDKEGAILWQQQAEREFALWAESKACDATGVNNFCGIQQLAFMSWMLSGDVFVLIEHSRRTKTAPYGLRLHVIEADRVASPTNGKLSALGSWTTAELPNGNLCHDGVEIDKAGAIVAYHIRNTYPQEYMARPTETVRILAYGQKTGLPNILHLMDSERPEQYRGVSYLAHVIEPLAQIKRYSDAELVAAVIQSFYTAFITTEAEPNEIPFNEATPMDEVDKGEGEEEDDYDNEYEMGPGQFNVLKPGENITLADPKRPTSTFAEFTHAIAEEIGAALEIPVDLLLKEFNSSYSASRAALMEAWKSFRMRRTWFIDDFCKPVWELWMTEAVALGRIRAPGFFSDPAIRQAYLRCEWIGPSQGQLDPVKEINAEVIAIEQGLTTREAAAIRYNGSSWDDNVKRMEYETERLRQATRDKDAIPKDALSDKDQQSQGGDADVKPV